MRLFTECIEIVGYKPKKYDELKGYVSTGAVQNNKIDSSLVEQVSYELKPSRADLCAEPGDILFAKMAGTKKTLLLNDDTADNIYSTGFFAVRPKKDLLLPKCLYYLVNSDNFLEQKDKNCSGATQKAITNKGLEAIKINIPSIHEQIRLIEILDILTNIIDKRNKQIVDLEQLVKSRFVEMFGDPVTNPKGLPIHQLSEYITFLTSGSRGWAKYFTNEGELFITIKNVKNCSIVLDDVQHVNPPDNAEAVRTKVQEGDLLISITADLGRTGVVSKEIAEYGAYINQHLSCIRLDKSVLNPLYVAYFMESPAGKNQFVSKNQSAVKAGLNFNSINTLKLIVPDLTKQKEFVSFVQQVDKQKFEIQKSLDEMQTLFDSLMQEYFG